MIKKKTFSLNANADNNHLANQLKTDLKAGTYVIYIYFTFSKQNEKKLNENTEGIKEYRSVWL